MFYDLYKNACMVYIMDGFTVKIYLVQTIYVLNGKLAETTMFNYSLFSGILKCCPGLLHHEYE